MKNIRVGDLMILGLFIEKIEEIFNRRWHISETKDTVEEIVDVLLEGTLGCQQTSQVHFGDKIIGDQCSIIIFAIRGFHLEHDHRARHRSIARRKWLLGDRNGYAVRVEHESTMDRLALCYWFDGLVSYDLYPSLNVTGLDSLWT